MKTIQTRLDALELAARADNRTSELLRAWVHGANVTIEDVLAIERGDWESVNPGLQTSRHYDRWGRAVRAMIGAMSANA